MKGKKKMKNKSSKILILALVIATMLCATFAVMTSATEAETKPEIISKNMLYSDRYSIMYAVAAETVVEAPVTLNVYREYPTNKSTAVGSYVATAPQNEQIGGETRSVYVFTGFGIGAQDFADKIYAQAIDKAGNKSEVVEYSVVEYFLERLYGGYNIDSVQKNLYETGLAFGAAAQDRYAAADPIRVNDYKYVRVEGGTVNGVTKGMFTKNTEITLALGEIPAGGTFNYWNVTVNGETTQITEANTTIALEDNTIIEADVFVPSSLGYFDTYGGYDFNEVTDLTSLKDAGVLSYNSAKISLNRTTTKGCLAVFDKGDGDKALGFGNNEYRSQMWVNFNFESNDAEYYVFEADAYFAEAVGVNDFNFFTISFIGADENEYAANSIKVETETTTEHDVFGTTVAANTKVNIAVIYNPKSGVVQYYVNGQLTKTLNVTPTDVAMQSIRFLSTPYAGQWGVSNFTALDNMYFGNVSELLPKD